MKRLLIGLIYFYQKVVSPWTPRTCRYYPTCSEYSRQAIGKYGAILGLWISIKRILRCHPFHEGGYDPLE